MLNRVISPWSDFLGEGGHYCVEVPRVKMALSLNNGAMGLLVKVLDYQSRGPVFKPTG